MLRQGKLFRQRAYSPLDHVYGEKSSFAWNYDSLNALFVQQIWPQKVEIQRGNGVPIAATPMDTGNGTR